MTSAYGAGALRRADAEIRQLGQGSRNPKTFPVAAGIYELAFGGEIDLEEADRVLLEAGTATGLPRREVWGILKSAKKKGADRPRRRPESGQVLATLPPEPPPQYPDPEIVRAFLDGSVSVLADAKACAFIESRGLDPVRVSRRGLCRVVPEDFELRSDKVPATVPRSRAGERWAYAPELGYRLLFVLVSPRGEPQSLTLRQCDGERSGEDEPKSLALKGRRLVLANRAGRALLKERGRPSLWRAQPIEVVLVEGETDYLAAATEEIPDGAFRAVFGIFSGSWTAAHAAVIPDDATVVIATDADAQGDKYADQIRRTLGARPFSRWKPTKGRDVCCAGGLAGGTLT